MNREGAIEKSEMKPINEMRLELTTLRVDTEGGMETQAYIGGGMYTANVGQTKRRLHVSICVKKEKKRMLCTYHDNIHVSIIKKKGTKYWYQH
jgi:hypothetical protein